ncbi:MAG: HD domain-containing phosphohydrolase [Thermoleophilaceae bacterium]
MHDTSVAPTRHRFLRTFQIVCWLWLAAFSVHALFHVGGHGLDSFFNDWVYNALILAAAASCLVRAVRVPVDRAAWLLLGFGLVAWAAAEIYNTVYLSKLADPPYPSISDALWLTFYPASYVAFVLLVRRRMRDAQASLWLDGLVAALAVTTVGEVLVFAPVVQTTGGSPLQVATDVAYPLADLLLLALVAGVFALSGWRPGRAWSLIGAGLAAMAAADSIYAYQAANQTYMEGTVLDALWPAATLLVAAAAWAPPGKRNELRLRGWRMLFLPAAFSLVAVGMLVYDHFGHVDNAAVVLAGLTLVAVIGRTAMTFGENLKMLATSRQEALTDSLTGLGNRRRLMADLSSALEGITRSEPRALIMFDLDGFKRYNDSFGHPAGDSLLARLGRTLELAVHQYGRAYRLGGDEFCALVAVGDHVERIVHRASAALDAHGRGFRVRASHGIVLLPQETVDADSAMQLADQRLYSNKGSRRRSAVGQQTRDVLMQVLHERQPDLHDHVEDVADLAAAVGRRMKLMPEDLEELSRAAELHDVGKMAVPEEILNKPGPLDDVEFGFIKQHTIVGERMLAAAPSLSSVAKIVRSSHERWDGSGYPDGLRGEEIPLAARIVLVCDAYHAMTSDRPYQPPVAVPDALAELRRCAGTHFDPKVIDVFCEEITSRDGRRAPHADPIDSITVEALVEDSVPYLADL